METSNLPDKKLKVIVIKMLTKLVRRMNTVRTVTIKRLTIKKVLNRSHRA